jgi:hypothetical protein
MMKNRVRTIEEAFLYIADCNLATVSSMAMLKSRKKGEFERQIRIAQTMVNWASGFNLGHGETRLKEVFEFENDVKKWAEQYMPEVVTK